jgi:hypothetical protein
MKCVIIWLTANIDFELLNLVLMSNRRLTAVHNYVSHSFKLYVCKIRSRYSKSSTEFMRVSYQFRTVNLSHIP